MVSKACNVYLENHFTDHCMVNIQMDLTGMESGVGCSCENGHGTSGSMKGEMFLDKQSYC